MPSVFAIAPLLGAECTTTPLTTKSSLSAATRTSRALVDFPPASGFFTASLGVFGATIAGLLAGVIIGYFTERCTSDEYEPTMGVARQAKMGPATSWP